MGSAAFVGFLGCRVEDSGGMGDGCLVDCKEI